MDVTRPMRVDGFASLHRARYRWRASPPVLSPTRGLKAITDNKDEFYLLVLIALAASCWRMPTHPGVSVPGIDLISLPLFGLAGYAFRQKRSLEASIKYTILSAAQCFFPAVRYGAGVCAVWRTCRSSRWVNRRTVRSTSRCRWHFRPDDCWPWLQTLSLVLLPVDARRIRRARLRRFPLSWRRRAQTAILGVVMRLFLNAPVGDSEAIR